MLLVQALPGGAPAPDGSASGRWALRDEGGDRSLPRDFTLAGALSGDLAHFRRALGPASGRSSGTTAGVADGAAGAAAPGPSTVLAAPADHGTEIWAAGVTYRRSREARTEESRDPDIYERVYDARRPELFFKSLGWRARGHGQAIAVRPDSDWNVPEPELAVVVCASGEIAGYTICDDVSSRSIEGENPLYLPQAKMYLGATALGPGIRPAWEVPDPYGLGIRMRVFRGPAGSSGAPLWEGAASTGELHRRIDDLVEHLFRADRYPHGVILATGTCLVPDGDFTLLSGDEVRIEIEGIGELANPVRTIGEITV
ncbi:fumarylacetoacetate hydrolase family protein [Microtetraspora niveoalba]|uniref:fumarylacetoacetate hydrolase family protein n=1 Tax=Microtetraspora niveoalba TaxID=46175 RepID=UPI0009FF3774|nr:fumarylacetoacetate hydrolase family protein [Microtetraspora niveoalba]